MKTARRLAALNLFAVVNHFLFLFFGDSFELTSIKKNALLIDYAIFIITLLISTIVLIRKYEKTKKEFRYFKFIINAVTEVAILLNNFIFIIAYILCSIHLQKKWTSDVRIYEFNFIYPFMDLVVIAIIYMAFYKYEKNQTEFKQGYKTFLNSKIWFLFVLSVALVAGIFAFDFYFQRVVSKYQHLGFLIISGMVILIIREGFSFFGFKNLINELEERIKYIDKLLKNNVDISTDLKKSIKDKKIEIELANKIQQALIPEKASIIGDTFSIDSKLIPAEDMSGDYYDYFYNSSMVVWVMADVMGKGMKAAMLASNLRICLKMLLNDIDKLEDIDPAELLQNVNVSMYQDLNKIGAYITMVVGVFNTKTGSLKTASAGHVPPLYISNNSVSKIESKSMAIGMKLTAAYLSSAVELKKGDAVVFYTDGALDVRNEEKKRLGSKSLIEIIEEKYINNNVSKSELISIIEENLMSYKGNSKFYDDVTISVLSMVDN